MRLLAIGSFGLLAACVDLTEARDAIPGNSYTKVSPIFAIQAWEMAATVAHIQEPRSCPTAKLVDTRVRAVQEDVIYSETRLIQGRWSEVWIFDKCGTEIRVGAEFTADENGTADGAFSAL